MRGWKSATLIHVQRISVYAWSAGGEITKSAATNMVITAETPIEPTPKAVTTRREQREPSTASTSALATGIATISHNNSIRLSLHLAQRICIQRFEVVVQLQHQGQSNRDFRRGHGENKEKGNLSVSLLPSRSGDHKG